MTKVRALAVSALVTLALAAPVPASAHVTVQPPEADRGGFAKLAFRTPNERYDAGTVKLEVTFPTEAPFAFFNVRAVPGWKSTVERTALVKPLEVFGRTINEAVSKVTWEGGTIPAGGFEEFEVSVGPLPEDADQLVFKALQTYSSGEVVRWIELREPGATEDPEHPAPVLRLASAESEADTAASSTASADDGLQDDVDSANRLALIAIAVAALAVVASIASFVRRRP